MSYLANSETTTDQGLAADFNCGWSVVSVLAELSLASLKATPAPKPLRTPRRAVKAPMATKHAVPEAAKAF